MAFLSADMGAKESLFSAAYPGRSDAARDIPAFLWERLGAEVTPSAGDWAKAFHKLEEVK